MAYRVGCDADGRLTAVHTRMIGDSALRLGRHEGLEGPPATPSARPYHCPPSTSGPSPSAPTTRSAGPSQVAAPTRPRFAMEGCLDQLAKQVGGSRAARRSATTTSSQPSRSRTGRSLSLAPHFTSRRGTWRNPSDHVTIAANRTVDSGLGLKNSENLGNLQRASRRYFRARRDGQGPPLLDGDRPERSPESRSVAVTRSSASMPALCVIAPAPRPGSSAPARTRRVTGTLARAQARWPTPAGAGPSTDGCTSQMSTTTGGHASTGTIPPGRGRAADHPTRRSATPQQLDRHGPRDTRPSGKWSPFAVSPAGPSTNPLLGDSQNPGSVHMGLELCADRGLPGRSRPPGPDEHDAALARHPPGPATMPPMRGAAASRRRSRGHRTAIEGVGDRVKVPTAGAVAAPLHDRGGYLADRRWPMRLLRKPKTRRRRSTADGG